MELSDIVVYDDVPTAKTLTPVSDNELVDASTAIAPLARTSLTMSKITLKNKLTRRMVKTDVPVMESVGSAGTQTGYIAAPKVAHVISVSTAVFCNDDRATPTEIAHALKMHINAILNDATAGTANAYVNATNSLRRFLVAGIGGD